LPSSRIQKLQNAATIIYTAKTTARIFRRKTEMNSEEGTGEISLNLEKEYKLKMELGCYE
jgi:hypothetical protein